MLNYEFCNILWLNICRMNMTLGPMNSIRTVSVPPIILYKSWVYYFFRCSLCTIWMRAFHALRMHQASLISKQFLFFNTDFTYFSPKFPVPKRLINRRMHYVVITWMWKQNFQGPKAHFVVQIIFHWARPKLYTHFDFWVRRVAIISPNWVPYGL